MGWNEPPNGDKDKDPWGNRGNNDGPPDLNEIINKMQKGLGGMFGGGGRPSQINNNNSMFPILLGVILFLSWIIYDVTYFIDEQ